MQLAALGLSDLESQLVQRLPAGITERDVVGFFKRNRGSLTRALADLIEKQVKPATTGGGFQALYAAIQSRPGALELARELDNAIRRASPDSWVGVRARERTIMRAMYEILKDEAEVERLFLIVKQQPEYTQTEQTVGQVAADQLSDQRLAELSRTAHSRLNNKLLPYEVMGKLILREIGSPFKRGLIPATPAGFIRFAELAYSDVTESEWALAAVVREWFRRELPAHEATTVEFDWVLLDATVKHIAKGQGGAAQQHTTVLAQEIAREWRLYRTRLMNAAGLTPPPARKAPGQDLLEALPRVPTLDLPALDQPPSYKVEVQVGGESGWSSNAQRYPTRESAESAAKSLFSRWHAVREWRVVPSDDPANVTESKA